MPLSYAKIVANVATVALDFGDGDVLNISYHPAMITQARLLIGAHLEDAKTTEEV